MSGAAARAAAGGIVGLRQSAEQEELQIVAAAGGGVGDSLGMRGLAKAQQLYMGQIKDSTKEGYKSHLKTMCIFICTLMHDNDAICAGRKDLVSIKGEGDKMELTLNVPVPDAILAAFFGHIHTDKYLKQVQLAPNVKHLHNPKVSKKRDTDMCSASFFRGYKSALKWRYTECGILLQEGIDAIIQGVTAGQVRGVAQAKQKGELSAVEGRLPLTASGYRIVCQRLASMPDFNMSLFAWTFLVWSWNLMVRPINVGHLKFSDIQWVYDCLEIITSVEKTKQGGTNDFYKRHVYYNLEDPFLCPIFTLAILLVCRSFRPSDQMRDVFIGGRSEERFNDAIQSCIQNTLSEEERVHLGAALDFMGGYMSRKGCSSFVASMPGGPTYASWMLRAGWSMGVQGRYVHMVEGGGDEFLGRVLTMVSLFDGKKFSSLPARFHRADVQKLYDDKVLPTVFEFYDELPATFRPVLPMLLARLMHSWDWIEATLPQNHPIHGSRLVRSGALAQLRALTVLGGYGECKEWNLTVRVHPQIIEGIKAAEHREFVEAAEKRAAERHVEVMEALHGLPSKCGAVDPSGIKDFVQEELKKIQNKFSDGFADLKKAIEVREQSASGQEGARAGVVLNQERMRPQLLMWGGRLHPVSQDFVLRGDTVKAFWDCFFFGDGSAEPVPYRKLSGLDLQTDAAKVLLSKGKKIVEYLLLLYNGDADVDEVVGEWRAIPKLTVEAVAQMELATADEVFKSAFQLWCARMEYTYSTARACEYCVSSCYKRMMMVLR